jgi:hypothetical protein
MSESLRMTTHGVATVKLHLSIFALVVGQSLVMKMPHLLRF